MDVTPDFVLTLALYALIAFGIMGCGLTVVAIVMFKGHGLEGETVALIIQRTEFAKLATIVLIILATTLLGLLGLVEGEAVVAILSGIAGYVLGGRVGGKERQAAGGG